MSFSLVFCSAFGNIHIFRQELVAIAGLHGFLTFELPTVPILGLQLFQKYINQYNQVAEHVQRFTETLYLMNVTDKEFTQMIGRKMLSSSLAFKITVRN